MKRYLAPLFFSLAAAFVLGGLWYWAIFDLPKEVGLATAVTAMTCVLAGIWTSDLGGF